MYWVFQPSLERWELLPSQCHSRDIQNHRFHTKLMEHPCCGSWSPCLGLPTQNPTKNPTFHLHGAVLQLSLGQGCQTPQDKRTSAGPRYTLNSYIVALHAVYFTQASVFFVRHIKHRVGFNGWSDPVKANCMFKYKGWKDLYYSTNF